MTGFLLPRRGTSTWTILLVLPLLWTTSRVALSSGLAFTKRSILPKESTTIPSDNSNNNHSHPGRRRGRIERVVFFPTSAHWVDGDDTTQQQWIVVPIHGWIFAQERRIFSRRAFVNLLQSAFPSRRPEEENKITQQSAEQQQSDQQSTTAAVVR